MSEIGQRLIAAVRRIADERPDHVYVSKRGHFGGGECYYVSDGQPDCIIGHALWEAGLIDATFECQENNTVVIDNPELIFQLGLTEALDDDELEWLTGVQESQDKRVAWGNAVFYTDQRASA